MSALLPSFSIQSSRSLVLTDFDLMIATRNPASARICLSRGWMSRLPVIWQ